MDFWKRSKFPNSNSKIYMDLNDIIREHALAFLPAKSLFRCKSVCKDWKLQISTPFFAHNQTLSFRGFSGLLCQTTGESPSYISLDPKAYGVPDPSMKFLPEPVDILSSSYGLICCQGRGKDKFYYICNPVTQQWKRLPKPNSDHGPDPAVVLIFEPSRLDFVADYKLICAFQSSDFDNAYEFEIYSSEKGTWRVSGEIFFGNRKIQPYSGVYVNGTVYWLSRYNEMVAFNLMKERSLLIGFGAMGSLGVMNGKLCSFSIHNKLLNINVLSNIHLNTTGTINKKSSTVQTWERKCNIPLNRSENLGNQSEKCSLLFASSDVVVFRRGNTVISLDMKTDEETVLPSAFDDEMRYFPYCNNLVYF